MSFKAVLYAYILGGFTFIPLVMVLMAWFAWHTAVPVQEVQAKNAKEKVIEGENEPQEDLKQQSVSSDVNDIPKTRKGWLTVRRTFEEPAFDGGYVNLMRSFLDARSKDPKRSRPKDMWFVALKGRILYLYEDEGMTDCEAVIQLGSHDVVIYPEDLLDGELFTRRNAICLKPKSKSKEETAMPSLSREMKMGDTEANAAANVEKITIPNPHLNSRKRGEENERRIELEKDKIVAAREEALEPSTPWFIFVRSPYEMEDWYLAMIHASDNPPQEPLLSPLQPVFLPSDMDILVSKLDEQPDVIPMRWFNALFGRILLSFYRTQHLESFIIGRLMKKISKVKRPAFLPSIVVTEVSVGNRTPLFSKPMLKELTKEGDASIEVHLQYKGEVRITIEATALLTLPGWGGQYTVKIALAAILKEIEGNMLIKVKRPPSNRIWYAFTQTPKIVLEVEPIVSDRQITWGMILSTIESKIKEIIQESVVLPNMDDISYFESAGYEHRGGIWADAARNLRATPQPGTSQEPMNQTGLQAETTPEVNVVSEPGEVAPHLSKSPTTASTSSEPVTINVSSSEDSNGKNRRKTWFSSARGLDVNALGDPSEGAEDDRGSMSSKMEEMLPPRPHSAPQRAELSDVFGSDDQQQESSDGGSLASHKQRPDPPSAQNEKNDTESLSSSVNSTSSRNLDNGPKPLTPSSPSSFLTAFKAKAADKQALSNSAKEAMKKWGMNWGSLRKDTPSSSGSGQTDDLADHDSMGIGVSRTRTTSTTGNTSDSGAQKSRASYADVRAAVAERRGRQEGSSGSQADVEDDTYLTTANTRTRSTMSRSPGPSRNSAGTGLNEDNSISSAPPALTTLPRRLSSASSAGQRHMSTVDREDHLQAVPISRSSTQNSQHKDIGTGPPPIYSVQPQARTMSIPGIHSSHRGEVMSMGYVAPPQHPPTLTASSSPESKSKVLSSLGGSAGIQSVYKLFGKNQGPQQSQKEMEDAMELPPPTRGTDAQGGGNNDQLDSPSVTPTPSTTATIALPATPLRKKTPPPLPPRSSPSLPITSSSTVSRSPPPPLPPRNRMAHRSSSELSTATVSISADTNVGSLMTTPIPSSSTSDEQPSAASEKLKSIAKRASLTGPKEKEREDLLTPPSASVEVSG
ncbi:hypothetical protein E1B28_001654 [Marasmius oreades]|uniref:SMP-LTD domain-containing protein n=1 Tax=Marasmius oreades TaxID=181124 RepID=A0A9P7V470_9AGAR|nr:uncharacterized protein E1B28_001654 [Marasmius oreades]KAG7099847.1 hypothetical protein E1B28_001654 [Marasmius oreades]